MDGYVGTTVPEAEIFKKVEKEICVTFAWLA